MNLLIVDDEYSTLKAIQNSIDWKQLQFENVYTAMSRIEAIQCFSQHEVGLLLCDIEMPMGNGLELLEWVNRNQPGVQCLFMTCHADFAYAQKAVQLGSIDYILKPLDFAKLQHSLQAATDKALAQNKLQRAQTFISENQHELVRQFWKDYFLGEIATSEASIRQYCAKRQIENSFEGWFLPILVCVKQWSIRIKKEDQRLFFYALRKLVEELLDAPPYSGAEIVPFSDTTIFAMLRPDDAGTEVHALAEIFAQASALAQEHLNAVVCCYIGKPASIYEIPGQMEELQALDFNHVVFSDSVLLLGQQQTSSYTYCNESFEKWDTLLQHRKYAQMRSELRSYLDGITVDRQMLESLQRDFFYLLYDCVRRYNLFLNSFLDDDTGRMLTQDSILSVENFLRWAELVLERIEAFDAQNTSKQNPVELAKLYIKENLMDELPVETVAAHVHLNPDYLSRLFKKSEGVVLNRYIALQKMERAKWLLRHTEDSLGEVAAQLGYYNYSSFTRTFSKMVGLSPQEYKKGGR